MRVREATTDDVASVRAVAEASWERDYADLLTRDTVAAGVNDWYDEATLADLVTDERTPVYVAETESAGADSGRGDIAAFAHGYVDGETGHVLRLYVHPDERRSGVGRRVLDATVAALSARGSERVEATVLAANEQGRAFYEAQGFEEAGAAETTIGGETFPECRYRLDDP
ncbi:GNAT family N-acetyltransferase [Halobacterium jilantaiense]|uniref:Ribosomal protein S18 acetylase RimI n=1 Tax=Halobacterium jilantaiense TaxID=355548 RepID=A0A1I0QC20_9EURY|nr:GNAT family N-acetyltransferase [Halobacterium jilantaiense]SEW24605.1 Ribosomal protein S18 acetylase RimI [Halobacterium jilantaiense]